MTLDLKQRPIVAGVDPGLATFGMVAGAVEAGRIACGTYLGMFTSDTYTGKYKADSMDDMRRRIAELDKWLGEQLDKAAPRVVAAEEMAFLRDARSSAMLAAAWAILISHCERRRIPIVAARATSWRTYLIGPDTKPKGKTKAERKKRIEEREVASHKEAARRAPALARTIDQSVAAAHRRHVRDALGVLCWSVSTPLVRVLEAAVAR
jgi:Holliday junction resolvasome RuvABC endonuclease subunit